jgi:hypothetical protein
MKGSETKGNEIAMIFASVVALARARVCVLGLTLRISVNAIMKFYLHSMCNKCKCKCRTHDV